MYLMKYFTEFLYTLYKDDRPYAKAYILDNEGAIEGIVCGSFVFVVAFLL